MLITLSIKTMSKGKYSGLTRFWSVPLKKAECGVIIPVKPLPDWEVGLFLPAVNDDRPVL